MSRATVLAAFLALCLVQNARSASIELRDNVDGMHIVRSPHHNGVSKVWQLHEDEIVQQVRSVDQRSGNDFLIGIKRPGSVLVKREHVQSPADTHTFQAYSAGPITFIEARDQTNGTGGYVRFYRGGIQEVQVQLDFVRISGAQSAIDFIVEVWSEPSSDVSVRDFRLGELTERSLWAISIGWAIPAWEHETVALSWEMVGSDDDVYTMIEGFDMSADGSSGGKVRVLDGGVGGNHFKLEATGIAPGMPLNLTFVAYSESLNAGANFRFGRYVPGIQLLHYDLVEAEAIGGETVEGIFNFSQSNSRIEFMQGWDQVENGTGGIAAMAGGLGRSNASLILYSGRGEKLENLVSVYGNVVSLGD